MHFDKWMEEQRTPQILNVAHNRHSFDERLLHEGLKLEPTPFTAMQCSPRMTTEAPGGGSTKAAYQSSCNRHFHADLFPSHGQNDALRHISPSGIHRHGNVSLQEVAFNQPAPNSVHGLSSDYRSPPKIRETLARTLQHCAVPVERIEVSRPIPEAIGRGRSDLHYNISPRHARSEMAARAAQHMTNAETRGFARWGTAVTQPEVDVVHAHRMMDATAQCEGGVLHPANETVRMGVTMSDLHPGMDARSYRMLARRPAEQLAEAPEAAAPFMMSDSFHKPSHKSRRILCDTSAMPSAGRPSFILPSPSAVRSRA